MMLPPSSQISLQRLHAFLQSRNWSRVDHPNIRICVFHGQDINGHESRLVLPASMDLVDSEPLLESALCEMALNFGESIKTLVSKMMLRGFDALKARSFRIVGHDDSLPLDVASDWIYKMRQLAASSAYTEQDPRPYFEKTGSAGSGFASHCRFGHTFTGSFGVTIESPVQENPVIPSLGDRVGLPFERRVFQRIARGLQILGQAIAEDNIENLANSYAVGLNANMCRCLSEAFEAVEGRRIEYVFEWSSLVPPDKDVDQLSPFVFDGRAYEFSLATALQLEQNEEQGEETIEGKIYQLKSRSGGGRSGDELLPGDQIISMSWQREGRPSATIRVPLSPVDYQRACDAHRDDKLIQITGKPRRNGKFWSLSSAYGFRVLGDDK
jgi:hypothetical protein